MERFINRKIEWREYAFPIAVIMAILALSVLEHSTGGTTFNQSEKTWQAKLDLHLGWAPFAVRPLTSYSTLIIHNLTPLSIKESFLVLQYTLAFFFGLAFYVFLRQLKNTRDWSLIGLVLLMTALPVFLAHSEPIHTWDDFWAYLFLTLTGIALAGKRAIYAVGFFTLGCFAREQTLFFYPVFAGGILYLTRDEPPLKRLMLLAAPILIFGSYYAAVWRPQDPNRLKLANFNFASPLRTSDTLFSAFVAHGALWYVWCVSVITQWSKSKTETERFLLKSSLFAVPVTLAIGFFFSYTRETRIMFPAFIFTIPLSLFWLKRLGEGLYQRWHSQPVLSISLLSLAVVLSMTGGIWLAYTLFPIFEYRGCSDFQRNFAGAHFGMILFIISCQLSLIRRNTGDLNQRLSETINLNDETA
ncbi:MAG: hypothetical protein SGI97_03465 [candidate division Zixibacteria bacterium]|nr:hypothetical protein [candidate division Zixibacteria bacterium]